MLSRVNPLVISFQVVGLVTRLPTGSMTWHPDVAWTGRRHSRQQPNQPVKNRTPVGRCPCTLSTAYLDSHARQQSHWGGVIEDTDRAEPRSLTVICSPRGLGRDLLAVSIRAAKSKSEQNARDAKLRLLKIKSLPNRLFSKGGSGEISKKD